MKVAINIGHPRTCEVIELAQLRNTLQLTETFCTTLQRPFYYPSQNSRRIFFLR